MYWMTEFDGVAFMAPITGHTGQIPLLSVLYKHIRALLCGETNDWLDENIFDLLTLQIGFPASG